jgi:hypothetical protein
MKVITVHIRRTKGSKECRCGMTVVAAKNVAEPDSDPDDLPELYLPATARVCSHCLRGFVQQ